MSPPSRHELAIALFAARRLSISPWVGPGAARRTTIDGSGLGEDAQALRRMDDDGGRRALDPDDDKARLGRLVGGVAIISF